MTSCDGKDCLLSDGLQRWEIHKVKTQSVPFLIYFYVVAFKMGRKF